jgi:tripartite-type tricarboxylate transporter receptor subunit TctC
VVQVLKKGGLDAEGTTPQQYAAQIKNDLKRWAAVVKSAGVAGK